MKFSDKRLCNKVYATYQETSLHALSEFAHYIESDFYCEVKLDNFSIQIKDDKLRSLEITDFYANGTMFAYRNGEIICVWESDTLNYIIDSYDECTTLEEWFMGINSVIPFELYNV